MRTFFLAFVFVSSLLLVAGCSLLDTDPRFEEVKWIDFSELSQDSTVLIGEWKWIRSRGTFGVSTPRSTGQTETLIFTEDDTVEVYRNDKLERQTTWEDYLDHTQWGVKKDTLAISTAYIDGPALCVYNGETNCAGNLSSN